MYRDSMENMYTDVRVYRVNLKNRIHSHTCQVLISGSVVQFEAENL